MSRSNSPKKSNNLVIVPEKDKEAFNSLAQHPLQSWEWGEFRKSQGHQVLRLGLYEENKLIQVFQITFHHLPLVPLTIGYLPKSVLPTKETLFELKKIAKKQKAIFVKLEPLEVRALRLHSGQNSARGDNLVEGKPLFTKYTSIIDLTRSEEEILKSFKPKTRYNIHVAQKHGIEVKEDNSSAAFKEYLKLLFETTQRQGFYAHNKKYHQEQWQVMQPANISHLLTASYQGKVLSAFLLFTFNNVLYYPYGASTREHRELMAPTLLMWEAIKFGKKMGCQEFDLWGDTQPNPPENHPYFGFHHFKEGFSPKLVEYVGTYDLVVSPILYQIYKLSDKIRWKILHLKANLKGQNAKRKTIT